MNKNFIFWRNLAYLLMLLGIVLVCISSTHIIAGAPFGLGAALCLHLFLALNRAEKLLGESKDALSVCRRQITQDRPIVDKKATEELDLFWNGNHDLDLCLLETLPLPGIEYTDSVKHSVYMPVGKHIMIQNDMICHTTGHLSLGEVRAIISEDWGLIEVERSLEAPCLAFFYPPIYQKLQLSPQTAMGMSPIQGIHQLSRSGEGSELHEIRDYHPGDSYRKMLWGATARTGRLIVREFAAEVNIPVVFVLNTSWFLRFGSPRMMFDQLVETALVLAEATHAAGDPFGFCLYGDKDLQTRFSCQLPTHNLQQMTELMKCLLQIRVHQAPPPILNLPELEKSIVKLLNGKASSFDDYCDTSSIAKALDAQGWLPKDFSVEDKTQYTTLLAQIADTYGLPTPILHSHFKDSDSVETQLELQEVQRLDKLLSRLIPMIKDKALFIVSIRPYESNEATNQLCRLLSIIPRHSHRLLVLSPDYPSYTKNSRHIPRNAKECLQAILTSTDEPSSDVISALDFYSRCEDMRKRIVHLGGVFENIDAHKNIQFIFDMINKQRYPQGGSAYAQHLRF